MNAFAVRWHGRRWLGLNPNPPEGMQVALAYGWRPFRLVAKIADAEKFGSAAAAELFIAGLRGEGFEVVDLTPRFGGVAV